MRGAILGLVLCVEACTSVTEGMQLDKTTHRWLRANPTAVTLAASWPPATCPVMAKKLEAKGDSAPDAYHRLQVAAAEQGANYVVVLKSSQQNDFWSQAPVGRSGWGMLQSLQDHFIVSGMGFWCEWPSSHPR